MPSGTSLSAFGLLVYGPRLIHWVSSEFGLDGIVGVLLGGMQWVLIVGLLLTTFNLLYTYGPHLRRHRWRWLTPGTVAALVIWLLVSVGFKIYLAHFNKYSATYGSLGAVIILMMWLYLTGIAVLAGAEINAHLGRTPKEAP